MGSRKTTTRWIGFGLLLPVAVLIVLVAIVGVRTMSPLANARDHLDELEQALGSAARYVPVADGAISAERMEVFLRVRMELFAACGEYGPMQRAFDTVDSLDTRIDPGWDDVGDVSQVLGGAAFEITPFVGRCFERRNAALLAARMGLEEYAYIYALAYRDQLMSEQTRRQIFSDGVTVSPGASEMLRTCLQRQLESGGGQLARLSAEIERMRSDPDRLPWQDLHPDAVRVSLEGYRDRLEVVFCPATAGLEMEATADRAIRLALD